MNKFGRGFLCLHRLFCFVLLGTRYFLSISLCACICLLSILIDAFSLLLYWKSHTHIHTQHKGILQFFFVDLVKWSVGRLVFRFMPLSFSICLLNSFLIFFFKHIHFIKACFSSVLDRKFSSYHCRWCILDVFV